MADVLAQRELDFLHPVARADRRAAGPQHGDGGGQPLRASIPTAISPRRFWRWARGSSPVGQGGRGPSRTCSATASRAGLIAAIEVPRPRDRARFRFPEGQPGEAQGRLGAVASPRYLPREGGRIRGARDRLRRDGPDAAAVVRGGARARRASRSTRRYRPRRGGGGRGARSADRPIASGLVSQGGGRRASQAAS